ncbi:MAG TPA: CocE/NonD family hydrolase [Candidatus Dormibacteraeota bacterium]|nr:CocE/NonD family hydrolase [Candidatus Dormibacteraeota bacterium]
MMSFVGRQLIPASHGQLEAIYRPAHGRAERVALVLHPHPLHGGTMHNKVVYRTARALEGAGVVTLRINFRGVEGSSGKYDDGRGEVDDARTALDWLLAQQPAAREAIVAGFSFGASVGLRFGCGDARVTRVIAIGTPGRWLSAASLAACAKRIDFVHGALDDVAPLADVEALIAGARRTAPTELHVVAEAGHFFEGQLEALAGIVTTVAG